MITINELINNEASTEEIEEFVNFVLTDLEEKIKNNDKQGFKKSYLSIFGDENEAEVFVDNLNEYGLERLQEIEIWKLKTFFNIDMKRAYKPTMEDMLALWKASLNGKEEFEQLYNKIMKGDNND